MDAQEFLDTVLSPAGERCGLVISNKQSMQSFFESNELLAEHLKQADSKGSDAYFACATFQDSSSRRQNNVASVQSFWMDIDVGEGKGYPDAKAAVLALVKFCKDLSLPTPLVVSSGGGLHVYWLLKSPVEPDGWLPVAKQLKQAALFYGLKSDPACTADIARVLRLPGTHNHKIQGQPRKVAVVGKSKPQRIDLETFSNLLSEAMPKTEHQDGPVGSLTTAANNSDLIAGLEHPPSSAHQIAEACAVVAEVRDTKGNVEEPIWRDVLGVIKNTIEAPAICHNWSAGHADYTPEETNQKVQRLRDSIGRASTLCSTLESHKPDLCRVCPHKGFINSPITLGYQEVIPDLVDPPSFTSLANILVTQTAIQEMNRRFAYVASFGGDSTILHFKGKGEIQHMRPSELKTLLSNRYVSSDGSTAEKDIRPLAPYWLHHPRRLEFDEAIFDPESKQTKAGKRTLNLYNGFAIKPEKKICRLMLRHLYDVICRKDRDVFDYFINWMAFAVQCPGTAPGSMIILLSEKEGTGKTTVGNWLLDIFGHHGLNMDSPDQLTGQFNGHLRNKCMLVLNEPHFPGGHDRNNKLKEMITGNMLLIEEKYKTPYHVNNTLHIMVTTNARWAVAAGNEARRFVVLDVDESHAGDKNYFDALYSQAGSGGLQGLLMFLLDRDIAAFRPEVIPVTDALREQQMRSTNTEVQWAFDLLEEDSLPHSINFSQAVATAELHDHYLDWCKILNKHPMALAPFGRWLSQLGLQKVAAQSAGRRGYMLPDRATFEAAVKRSAGIH